MLQSHVQVLRDKVAASGGPSPEKTLIVEYGFNAGRPLTLEAYEARYAAMKPSWPWVNLACIGVFENRFLVCMVQAPARDAGEVPLWETETGEPLVNLSGYEARSDWSCALSPMNATREDISRLDREE